MEVNAFWIATARITEIRNDSDGKKSHLAVAFESWVEYLESTEVADPYLAIFLELFDGNFD